MCHAMTMKGRPCRMKGPWQKVTLERDMGTREVFETGLCTRHYHELEATGRVRLWRPAEYTPGLLGIWYVRKDRS